MYIGVDTHKTAHVLVALDEQGHVGETRSIPNTSEGWASALRWACAAAGERIWGIENSGALGKGLAQFLVGQGEMRVHEVSPHRTAQYRRRGRTQDKTDETDALAIARLLLAEGEALPCVHADDASTELRLLSDYRDNLVAERTRLINQLHAQMVQINTRYQEQSGRLTQQRGIMYCRDLTLANASAIVQTRLLIVHQLAAQILRLATDIAATTTALRTRVQASQTPLLRLCGVGDLVAARIIGEVGSAPRIASAAAFAALAGAAPVAVSSGRQRSYRLNRGGNRQLNRALHMIALSQRRCDPRGQTYYAKKRAEGETERAAMRCLKRQLANVVYRLLREGHRAETHDDADFVALGAIVRTAA